MGNLKNYIIKKLGGYTVEEYKSATSIRAQKIHEIARLELVDVKAETEISRVDYEHMDEELSARLVKARLMQQLEKEVEPFVRFVLWKPGPFNGFIAEAKLQVLRPRREAGNDD